MKQKDSGSFSSEIAKGDPVTLIFANLNAVKPTLKIGTVEMQLELLHAEGIYSGFKVSRTKSLAREFPFGRLTEKPAS